jgi:tetratricopeptide (TPR) repeat protein
LAPVLAPSAAVLAAAVAVPAPVRAGRADQKFCRAESDDAGLVPASFFDPCILLSGRLPIPRKPRERLASMAIPVPRSFSGASRLSWRASALALLAITLCGCSFDLGSWSSAPDKEAPPKAAPAGAEVSEAQAATTRGQTLARSGKTEEALAEFDRAITLDPHNAQALYNRGLLCQGEGKHQLAVDDFTAANGLTPQRAEPLLGRAVSYLALDKIKEAAADLDEAVQADPQNGQIWMTRGLAYERLGDRTRAAGSYARAINLRPKDEAARTGFARVGGKPGQSYDAF